MTKFEKGKTYPMRGGGEFLVLTTESGIPDYPIAGIVTAPGGEKAIGKRRVDGTKLFDGTLYPDDPQLCRYDLIPPATKQTYWLWWNDEGPRLMTNGNKAQTMIDDFGGHVQLIAIYSDGKISMEDSF